MSAKGLGKKELYIQTRLAQAIRDERIATWFQPQVTAKSGADGVRRLTGVEALARWHDADLGWISPGSFIPMAENLGLINDLGQLVRRQALNQFQRWRTVRPYLLLSLNISKRQLFAPDFVDALIEDARRYGIPPAALVLEVTESVALMEVECAEERLCQLVDAGFTLSIDDFGTGYASLSQLHELPVGELKIDISFVQRVHTADGLRILQAIVHLARALGLRTVAEGVEDAATTATLCELEVDILQGYHFGGASSAEELEKLALFTAGAVEPARPGMERTLRDGVSPNVEVLSGPASRILWELVQHEARLQTELLHAEKLAGIGSFAAGIAHDMNNPLQLILGLAENLTDETDLEAVHLQAHDIIEAVKRTTAICRDLTSYSRRASLRQDCLMSINGKLDEALKIARYAVALQDIDIRKLYQPDVVVQGNPDELPHVFVNSLPTRSRPWNTMAP